MMMCLEAKEVKKVVDIKTVKENLKVIRDFEKERNMKLLNDKGLEEFAALWKQYEKEYQLKDYVDKAVDPLKKQLDLILSYLEKSQPKETSTVQQPTKIDDIRAKVDDVVAKKEEVKQFKWEKITDTNELKTWQYGSHIINVYNDSKGTRMANIDDGENVIIRNDEDIIKLRKKVEALT